MYHLISKGICYCGDPIRSHITEPIQASVLANPKKDPLDTKHEYPPLANNIKGVPAKENAVSDATDHGAISLVARKNQQSKHTPKRGASAMSKYGKADHKRAAKTLGYALTLGDEAAWHGFTIVLLARLTEHERAALAFAALNSLEHNNAYKTASVALFRTLGGRVVG